MNSYMDMLVLTRDWVFWVPTRNCAQSSELCDGGGGVATQHRWELSGLIAEKQAQRHGWNSEQQPSPGETGEEELFWSWYPLKEKGIQTGLISMEKALCHPQPSRTAPEQLHFYLSLRPPWKARLWGEHLWQRAGYASASASLYSCKKLRALYCCCLFSLSSRACHCLTHDT